LIELEDTSSEALNIAQKNLLMLHNVLDVTPVADTLSNDVINSKIVELRAAKSLLYKISRGTR